MFFAECNLAFVECLMHSAKNLNLVVRGAGTRPVLVTTPPPLVVEAASACSSSHMLLAVDDDWDSFLTSSRRSLIRRTESFSIAADGSCFSHGLGEGLKK